VERADDVHLRHAVAEHRAHHGHVLLPLLTHLPQRGGGGSGSACARPAKISPQTPVSLRAAAYRFRGKLQGWTELPSPLFFFLFFNRRSVCGSGWVGVCVTLDVSSISVNLRTLIHVHWQGSDLFRFSSPEYQFHSRTQNLNREASPSFAR
jgi:hypothetical protein